jgi:hypothetical protein
VPQILMAWRKWPNSSVMHSHTHCEAISKKAGNRSIMPHDVLSNAVVYCNEIITGNCVKYFSVVLSRSLVFKLVAKKT